MKSKTQTTNEITIVPMRVEEASVCIIGRNAMIYNAMSEKSKHELLLPRGRRSAAAKAETLKHDPLTEYRNSVYRYRADDGPTRLFFPTGAFKKAIATAALDLPGVKKTQVARLCWITEDKVSIYGTPQVLMSVVRSADMNRTPDIRTRAILPKWACTFKISSAQPILKHEDIVRLLTTAGFTVGIGDWRQEKGSGSFGQFRICPATDPEFKAIVKSGGIKAQDAALEEPAPYDVETETLWSWYGEQMAAMKKSGTVAVAPEVETEAAAE